MTTKRQAADPDQEDASEVVQSGDRPSSAPSGVFRTSERKRRDSGWSVAAQFEQEGFSYRVLRRPLDLGRNDPGLTKREQDALELACAGHGNKGIAQILDVSPSTVGVLLFRAAAKLNAKSRSELLSTYEQFKAALLLRATDRGGNEPTK
ncbi:MAG TPA: helix-turn-helix transcriptional regulator [Polyangiaceae bacterium]|jgi:DNA-binding CsgD family transcriptional regulator|nr:helix-turn-helix transcriptional regulator [Polyangiaceae bacterium]